MRTRRPLMLGAALLALGAALLALGACTTHTGVPTEETYVPATRAAAKPKLPPPANPPPRIPSLTGARAISQAQKDVVVQPTNLDLDGDIWQIDDVQTNRVYAVPVSPMTPTVLLFPPGETLTEAVAGATEDFTISSSVSGNRAAVTVMPSCANPETERYAPGTNAPHRTCRSPRTKATFITSGGIYSVVLDVYDWTGVRIVEMNHAPPPKTDTGPKAPFPEGPATALRIIPEGDPMPPWTPEQAWADAHKMVIRFPAPLPVLPALFAGEVEQVNYDVVQTSGAVFIVTDRRVTEAVLRNDDREVKITAKVEPQRTRPRGIAHWEH